jgi:hypothetical protein
MSADVVDLRDFYATRLGRTEPSSAVGCARSGPT